MFDPTFCTLCPRACGADRTKGAGFCGAGEKIKIARAAPHFWEEPCLSGTNGAGTVFFSGCPLHCAYCQNEKISKDAFGKEVTPERFTKILFELKAAGVHNIDLITPMHFAPQIRAAILPVKQALGIPVVINTGGYDSPLQLSYTEGVADIYLPDYKYCDAEGAAAFSSAPDYPEVAERAIREMVRQVGAPVFDENGLLQRGVLVRHLILPGRRKESIAAIERLSRLFSPDEILLSVMSQFTPRPGALPPLDRRVTSFEARSVVDRAAALGFRGYCQQRSSAKEEFVPAFDFTGV